MQIKNVPQGYHHGKSSLIIFNTSTYKFRINHKTLFSQTCPVLKQEPDI